MHMTQTILSIETATANKDHPASIALRHNGHDELVMLDTPNSQAAQLVLAIEGLLTKHSLWYDGVNRLVITVGPGSFTGIRIGLSVARTIAFSCPNIALHPITTLEAMVSLAPEEVMEATVLMRAGKGELYSQAFRHEAGWRGENDIAIIRPESVASTAYLIGNGYGDLNQQLNALAGLHALDNVSAASREPVPLYIRAPDAALPRQILAT